MYKTLYDVSATNPVNWQILLLGVGFILVATYFFVRKEPQADKPRWLPGAMLGFSIFWTALGVGLPYYSSITHAAALRNGSAHVVEGPVQEFRSRSDCKNEAFSVSGHAFEYSYYEEMGRFHYPKSCGGPIRPGMNVRITFVGEDDIIKVEEWTRSTQRR